MEILSVFDILLEAEDSPFLEVNGLADDLAQDIGVIEGLVLGNRWLHRDRSDLARDGAHGCRLNGQRGTGGLRAWEHEDAWALENLSLNLVGLETDGELPLLDFLRVGDHLVEGSDALYAVIGLLEETLSNVGHDPLVFTDLGRDTNQDTEFGRQINVLLFLLNFKKRLFWLSDLGLVHFQEVIEHPNLFVAVLALVEHVGSGRHFPADSVDLVGTLLTVVGHDDGSVEVTLNVGLILKSVQALVYNC